MNDPITYAAVFGTVTSILVAVIGFYLKRLYEDVDTAKEEIMRLREGSVDRTTFEKHIESERLTSKETRDDMRAQVREVVQKIDGLSAVMVQVQIALARLTQPKQE